MVRNMSQRLSLLLVVLGLAWGLLLLRYTVQQPRHQSSAQIRQQILELSHRYVKVLREERESAPGGPQGTALAGYADLKRTIAVLLDDILSRLSKLEGKMELMGNSSSLSTNSSLPVGGALSSAPVSLQRTRRQNPSQPVGGALSSPPLSLQRTRRQNPSQPAGGALSSESLQRPGRQRPSQPAGGALSSESLQRRQKQPQLPEHL